ncbi:MAG: YdcF family protein [Candidatus Nanoarchaeia archaeon]
MLSPSQLQIASSLDALIVPGGEDTSRSRSQHALDLLLGVQKSYGHQPILVASGKPQVTYNYQSFESEAQATLHYVKTWHSFSGLPLTKSLLFAEEKSLDTFGNFYFSKELLDQALSGFIRKRIGIITNPYHVDRSVWSAKQFFPDYEIEVLPTKKQFAYAKNHFNETAALTVFKLVLINKDPEEFLKTRHPLYAPLSKSSPVLKQLFKERIKKYRNV